MYCLQFRGGTCDGGRRNNNVKNKTNFKGVNMDELIVVKQLPVIVEHLQQVKEEVTAKVNDALNLICTEDTIQEVKKTRAELSKEFTFWEEKRKEVKKAVLSPYEQFEAIYKDCITEGYKTADKELKAKIDTVENELKAQKQKELSEYFDELICAAELETNKPLFEWVKLTDANINITLSTSLKKLKEQAKAFVDRICDDLKLIDTQESAQEILYEYQKSLNVSGAITTVVNRHKAIAEANAWEQDKKVKQEAQAEAVAKVEAIAPPKVEEETLTVAFKVTATRTKLKALKEFLKQGGYDYE